MEQTEKINEARNSIIENLKREMPEITKIICEKGYLVTSVEFKKVVNKDQRQIYMMIDFTSKQIEHLHDIGEYTKEIYRNFMGEPHFC